MLDAIATAPAREHVIVALDCGSDEALRLAGQLEGRARWVKVGMTLYYACGPSIVRALKEHGFKVFLDLKLHDIPHQIEGAAASAAASGADMLTFHTLGGVDMLRAGVEGAHEGAARAGTECPVTLGITVLTSMTDASLARIGLERTAAAQVELLGGVAAEAGIDGVVASPHEAAALRAQLGPAAYIVTPGVRPVGADRGDQNRVATPAQAFAQGASHIVIGRPITQATSPIDAFEQVCAQLA
ncbi:orotidine-5'-phosphate decarboxylase [Berryella wangjianweii]|uniref:Orotidine 5'-phosphate decarboxylase n=1 Tax=Berryella wangjianweii TaxID=2734634 RepID=A0A6M8J6G9_9ACTN|nr:orotidine-5'-phosphate decarboxylase [Berryella wangjianweii]NPD32630.1 orotidine-5'-phosphate decarboxylase [Eggerthellaceae bacterium zg-997]QKF07009.1 orotidine-5'-phosphate decarboxylase [Berryella wangjianweii]